MPETTGSTGGMDDRAAAAVDAQAHLRWENWSADLATGLVSIGDITRRHYGLESGACGFIDLVRSSEPKDQRHILTLLEEASVASSSFCYSTIIHSRAGGRHPVLCVAESVVGNDAASGTIAGLFAFPRFSLEQAMPARDNS